ncbi:helix-turn-helix domain-containing protein [Jidongwangia harbinensis]|uniref:helix-turn-helix domain-containing protein n=1 Tax=Jidongwangia harbinensis TaxID=2878561 RepID=UPI001CD9FD6A|nr:helix-turn-helix domain-containing protein [Jidongwangia harbinensis]MCA2211519.1 helix-turn-helix domain-containing protein [Jidongwangia harbinensis]
MAHDRRRRLTTAERIDRWSDVLAASAAVDHVDPPGYCADLLAVPAERHGLRTLSLIDEQKAAGGSPEHPAADNDNVIAMMLIEAGHATAGYADRGFPLQPGDVLFWDGGVALRLDVTEPVRRRTLLFPRAPVIQLCPEYDALLGRPIPDRSEPVGTLFEVVHLLRRRLPAMEARIRHTAAELLLQLVGMLDPAGNRLHDRRQVQLLDRILRYIDDNLADPALSPAGIAAAHAVSERTLYSLFREIGTPVGAHIRERRLVHGYRDVVHNTDDTLTRIAGRWGFASAAHFSRLFHQRYGKPPSHLRRTTPRRGELNR